MSSQRSANRNAPEPEPVRQPAANDDFPDSPSAGAKGPQRQKPKKATLTIPEGDNMSGGSAASAASAASKGSREELGVLKKSALLKRAQQAGVDKEDLREADEAHDPKEQLIKLILAKEAKKKQSQSRPKKAAGNPASKRIRNSKQPEPIPDADEDLTRF